MDDIYECVGACKHLACYQTYAKIVGGKERTVSQHVYESVSMQSMDHLWLASGNTALKKQGDDGKVIVMLVRKNFYC